MRRCDTAPSRDIQSIVLRGICYDLVEDTDAALNDFQTCLIWANAMQKDLSDEMQAQMVQVQTWVTALEAGEEPFSEEVLAKI